MSDKLKLKENYTISNCCKPDINNEILGYYSHDNIIKIHNKNCPNLSSIEKERLINLNWDEAIEQETEFEPDTDFQTLDITDFAILKHHLDFGIDYSLVVAKQLNISKQEAFERHKKLKELKLIERVDAAMVQYRKGIVDNKWIKHRNHTYYKISSIGENYLSYYHNNTGK
jgi:hypothetical protein